MQPRPRERAAIAAAEDRSDAGFLTWRHGALWVAAALLLGMALVRLCTLGSGAAAEVAGRAPWSSHGVHAAPSMAEDVAAIGAAVRGHNFVLFLLTAIAGIITATASATWSSWTSSRGLARLAAFAMFALPLAWATAPSTTAAPPPSALFWPGLAVLHPPSPFPTLIFPTLAAAWVAGTQGALAARTARQASSFSAHVLVVLGLGQAVLGLALPAILGALPPQATAAGTEAANPARLGVLALAVSGVMLASAGMRVRHEDLDPHSASALLRRGRGLRRSFQTLGLVCLAANFVHLDAPLSPIAELRGFLAGWSIVLAVGWFIAATQVFSVVVADAVTGMDHGPAAMPHGAFRRGPPGPTMIP